MGYLTPDGRWLVTAPPGDAPLRSWEVGSWQPGPTVPRPSAKPLALAPSPDGTVLVSMEPGPPRFFHPVTGKELATLEAPRNYGGAAGARFSPDGAWLAVATGNHTIHVWDLRAIRRGLAELDLDWELPAYRPPVAQDKVQPLRALVSSDVVQFLNGRSFLRGQEQTQAKQWLAAVDSYSKVIERDPSRPDAYHQRACAHAELDQWLQAAADFAKVAEFNPDQAGISYFRALACLAGDDLDGYRRTCARMLERIAPNARPADAYWIVWTCALGPGSTAEPAQTVRLAEKVVANPLPAFDSATALGASLYRARRFEEAAGRLREVVAAHESGKSVQRQPIAYTLYFLAMAEHRLGHSDEARKCLELAADSVAKREAKEGLDAFGVDTIPWNRRITLQLLHREAETVLKEPR